MSGMPRTYMAGGAALLGPADSIGPFLRGLFAAWLHPPVEHAYLSGRMLPFEVHPIGARPDNGGVYAFAYRYGLGWRVLYVGSTTDAPAGARHKIGTAIGYGATHLLVRPLSPSAAAAEEARLIDELAPPLNASGRGGWR